MTKDEQIADAAAKLAVKKTFAVLGVDVDRPAEVEEFRRDLRWAGDMRRAQRKGWLALIAVIAAGIGAAFWAGLRSNFSG